MLGIPAAWGDDYFADRNDPTVRVSPDLADRPVAAAQVRQANTLDARERALGVRVADPRVSPLDARERAFDVKRVAELPVLARKVTRDPFVDDRFRSDATNTPVPVVASPGRELEWPQIGIGFLFGIVLMLGIYLAMKPTRPRPLAH